MNNRSLGLVIASLFAAGAAMAATGASGAGALSGSTSGSSSVSGSVSGSTNTNTNTATSSNTNTNTNTNAVNVYGPGSNKLAKQQAASGATQPSTNVSMMPGKGKTATAPTHSTRSGDTKVAQSTTHGAKPCPPGLAKKDNGCLPPGQAKKLSADTHVMGNVGTHHERTRKHRD
jgi:hypothetical protein